MLPSAPPRSGPTDIPSPSAASYNMTDHCYSKLNRSLYPLLWTSLKNAILKSLPVFRITSSMFFHFPTHSRSFAVSPNNRSNTIRDSTRGDVSDWFSTLTNESQILWRERSEESAEVYTPNRGLGRVHLPTIPPFWWVSWTDHALPRGSTFFHSCHRCTPRFLSIQLFIISRQLYYYSVQLHYYCTSPDRLPARLLHGHALGQVSRLVNIIAPGHGRKVREQLQRSDEHHRRQKGQRARHI